MAHADLSRERVDQNGIEVSAGPREASSGPAPHEIMVFCLVLLGIVLAASAATLVTYPAIHTDEPWYANLAWNWATTGNRWSTLDVGPLPEGRGAGTTRLGALPTRLAVQLGGLSVAAIRLPSLGAGVLLLGIVAATGRLVWAWPSGLLAALGLALQPLLLVSSHMARPEIWLAVAVQGALACTIIGWKRRQPAWDIAAALLTAVSVEIHQNGAAFAVGLVAGYAALYGLQSHRQRNVLAFLATGLIAAAAYFLHRGAIVPIALVPAEDGTGTAAAHAIPLLSSSPLMWIMKEVARYLYYLAHSQLAGLVLILGVLAAVGRWTPADRLLLVWMLGSAVGMMVLVSRLFESYLLPTIAVGSLLVGQGTANFLRRSEPWRIRSVAITSMVLMVTPVLLVARPAATPPEELHENLRAAVRCGRIVGPNEYWLAFTDCDYRSIDVLNHYHHRQGLSLEEAMTEVRPDYLIVDETMMLKLEEDFGTAEGEIADEMLKYYGLPETALERFLDEHTTVERLLFQRGYGTIRIHRVQWRGES